MSTEKQRELIAMAYRALGEGFPNFVVREQQKQMVSRVTSLVTKGEIGLIEAPTGTGKSLGYLIPGIIASATNDKVLVIATATASLQDQLASNDVPQAIRAIEAAGLYGIRFAVAKGRERHLCPVKLDNVNQSRDLFQTEEQKNALSEIAEIWEGGKWSGVRDTIPITVSHTTWAKVSNTAAACIGDGCPAYSQCPYYASVAAAKEARVIITNHDYLLTMMANVDEHYLVDTEKNIYIFDEAHHLADKILSSFAKSLDLTRSWKEELRRVEELIGNKTTSPIGIAAERLQGMWNAVAAATSAIIGDGTQHRFALGEAPNNYLRLLLDLAGSMMNMRDVLDDATKQVSQRKSGAGSNRRQNMMILLASRVGQIKGDLDSAIDCINEFCEDDNTRARWLVKGRSSLEIKCSPFDSAEKARRHVWPRVKTAVLTSATLTSCGKFDAIRCSLGLPEGTPTLKLDSPLDYTHAQLMVPKYAVDGNNTAHSSMVRAFCMDFAINGEMVGILVYFTSRKLMREVYDSLSDTEKALILLQGDWQPSAMIAEHKRRVDLGQRSILFGLDSLSEGVDLPGEYCTRVLVTRLPFPSPDDPVMATHAEHLKSKGIEPFHIITMPKASRKLAQIVGRLIRREGDSGDVIVLDSRLCSKTYGKQMIRSTAFTDITRG